MIMGKTAELLVQEFGITRTEQDEYALQSHQKATRHGPPGGSMKKSCRSTPPRRVGSSR